MNPEFRRQLWLQFSVTRLALLPLLLAGVFTAVYLSTQAAPAEPLAAVAMVLFGVLVMGMGTFAAGSSVMDEIADRTWDQQRMSATQPWAMTWGKLAGATAYGWYGGALCLLVALPSALLLEPLSYVLKLTAMAVLAGVFLQALLIAINLQLLKSGSRVSRRGSEKRRSAKPRCRGRRAGPSPSAWTGGQGRCTCCSSARRKPCP